MRIFDDMKKFFTIAMLMLALVACRDQVQQVSGSYSYKISGKATVNGISRNLSDEIGTLDIIHKTDSTALLTFNAMGGSVYYTNAKIKDKNIDMEVFSRRITQSIGEYDVQVIGSGKIYDGTIIFDLMYIGSSLKADNLVMVCKRN